VDPVLAAALIGVGGSVIVAVVGFLTTRAITGETIKANSATAREGRLWDKRSAAYEAALAELASRQVRQQRVLRLITTSPDTLKAVEALQEYFASRDTPAWAEMQGRLLAYATNPVLEALEAARTADEAASRSYDEFVENREKPKPAKPTTEPGESIVSDPVFGSATVAAALGAMAGGVLGHFVPTLEAIRVSTTSDRVLIERIRAELQGLPGELPAQDRRAADGAQLLPGRGSATDARRRHSNPSLMSRSHSRPGPCLGFISRAQMPAQAG